MRNTYLSFISDEHLFTCIENLHLSYLKAKENITKKKFYNNKIDTFKLTFDAKFNGVEQKKIIEFEILRQIDKSINNAIGSFHEEILGGVQGFERGVQMGFDIKAVDDSLFADIKNKHNTMNSSSAESLFQKLAHYADTYKKANCYWVQILAKTSFEEPWFGEINGKEYSHSRVFKISGDQFYARLTGEKNALYDLYKSLPTAIDAYLKQKGKVPNSSGDSALAEIEAETQNSKRNILDQITFENYGFYFGFDRL